MKRATKKETNEVRPPIFKDLTLLEYVIVATLIAVFIMALVL